MCTFMRLTLRSVLSDQEDSALVKLMAHLAGPDRSTPLNLYMLARELQGNGLKLEDTHMEIFQLSGSSTRLASFIPKFVTAESWSPRQTFKCHCIIPRPPRRAASSKKGGNMGSSQHPLPLPAPKSEEEEEHDRSISDAVDDAAVLRVVHSPLSTPGRASTYTS